MRGLTATAIGLLLLRLAVGLTMLLGHGWRKVVKFPTLHESFSDPLGIGSSASLFFTAGAEAGCSILLILGLATRPAAGALLFTMGVIVFLVHGADPFKMRELPLLYGFVYAALLMTGGGKLSLDHFISEWRARGKGRRG